MQNSLAAIVMVGGNSSQAGILLHGPPGSMRRILFWITSFASHVCFIGWFVIMCSICLLLWPVTANRSVQGDHSHSSPSPSWNVIAWSRPNSVAVLSTEELVRAPAYGKCLISWISQEIVQTIRNTVYLEGIGEGCMSVMGVQWFC